MIMIREFYMAENLHFDANAASAAALELISDASLGRIFLIGDGLQSVGYCVVTFGYSLEFHGRFALIDEFYVREESRGSGLGSAALSFVEHECGSMNVSAVRLEVDRSNARVRRLYERHDFEAHDRDLMSKLLTVK